MTTRPCTPICLLLFALALVAFTVPSVEGGSFGIQGDNFVKDGQVFRILSGSLHYWRARPADWDLHFRLLKQLGLNTITTYVNWALHEPQPGQFNFTGDYDVVKWIKTAQANGLLVIARIGPYITAETDFGGLPWWLNLYPEMKLRRNDPNYLKLVDRYFDQLMPLLVPLQYSHGGPIINFQIEDDTTADIPVDDTKAHYLYLYNALRKRGIDSLINTLAYPTPGEISTALTPGCWLALELTYNTPFSLAVDELRFWYPTGPIMIMEVYPGWYNIEGARPPQTLDPVLFANSMDELLSLDFNASLNIYPLFGGTNFGFSNGADHPEYIGPIEISGYHPDSTSYDFDTALDEAGDPTQKFYTLQAVFSKYFPVSPAPIPPPSPKGSYGLVQMNSVMPLLPNIQRFGVVNSVMATQMERLGYGYGYVLYAKKLTNFTQPTRLHLREMQDRALVYLDSTFQGALGWTEPNDPRELILQPSASSSSPMLYILVENKGRCSAEVNGFQYARKGIHGPVRIGDDYNVTGWSNYLLPMTTDDLSKRLSWQPFTARLGQQPVFYRGVLNVPSTVQPPLHTFLLTNGWGRGFVMINGFNLGRFTELGPQCTLYVPASVLRSGANEVIIFESDYTLATKSVGSTTARYMQSVNRPFWS